MLSILEIVVWVRAQCHLSIVYTPYPNSRVCVHSDFDVFISPNQPFARIVVLDRLHISHVCTPLHLLSVCLLRLVAALPGSQVSYLEVRTKIIISLTYSHLLSIHCLLRFEHSFPACINLGVDLYKQRPPPDLRIFSLIVCCFPIQCCQKFTAYLSPSASLHKHKR